jgi:hypothetical protein
MPLPGEQIAHSPKRCPVRSAPESYTAINCSIAQVATNIVLLPHILPPAAWTKHLNDEVATHSPLCTVNNQSFQQQCPLWARNFTEVIVDGLKDLVSADCNARS